MTNYKRRLTRLETHIDVDEDRMAWADVHHALQRQTARALLAMGNRLGVDPNDPRLVEALTWLMGDDPARVAQDVEIITRWRRQQGITIDTGEVRQHLSACLEAMARRLQTEKE
jgi:hypothetical protein